MRKPDPFTVSAAPSAGLLIMNADDWGRDPLTTDRTLDCLQEGAVTSVSAMVFMMDSQRAAAIAREHGIEVGLHLNFTTALSGPACPPRLAERQQDIGRFLRRTRLSRVVFHPGLSRSFAYVVEAQLEEFRRLYGDPHRIDGHHHMHLSANVLCAGLLPRGTLVRRNFSFQIGERSAGNVLYRRFVDRILARRHRVVDFFFSLSPFQPASRLHRIFALARDFVVELETHPDSPEEYRFLTEGELFRHARAVRLGPPSAIADARLSSRQEVS
jgi:hypothetical protein